MGLFLDSTHYRSAAEELCKASFFADLPKCHFWAAWVLCVVATPVLERSTKLWLLFAVAYRKYKRLKPGQSPPRAGGGGAGAAGARKTTMKGVQGEGKNMLSPVAGTKKTSFNSKGEKVLVAVDSRKLLMERDALEDLLYEVFGILARLFNAEATALAKKH
eukprot:g13394.t1